MSLLMTWSFYRPTVYVFLTFFCLAYSFLYLLLKIQCFFWISVISSMIFDHIDTSLLLNELRYRDIMCTTFWSGDIIGTGYFCPRHFDGDIFTATFSTRTSFTVFNVVYVPFFTRTTSISEKNSFMTLLLLCPYFRTHSTTLLLKILGRRMHGPSPTSNFFGGTVPQSLLGLRP